MGIKRRRFKQTQPLEVRLAEEAKRLREKARSLPSGRLRDEVEKKALKETGPAVQPFVAGLVTGTVSAGLGATAGAMVYRRWKKWATTCHV